MKKILSILLISAILTGCGNISEDKPFVAEETTTVSQKADDTAETTASDATDTTASAVTVTNEVTTSKSSQSVTDKTAENITAEAENADVQPEQESENTHIVQETTAPEVRITESKTTTAVQTKPQRVTTTPVTTTKAHTTKAAQTTVKQTTTSPPITTQAPITEIYTEPSKMNVTEHWLIYFGSGHDKNYYVNIGKELQSDGSESGKAQAVFDYVTSNYSDDNACTYLSAITMCICEGIGLDCEYALISDWYAHCANAVKVDGEWYILDTQAGGYLCGNFGFTRILDEYENELGITLSDYDY